MTVTSDIDRLVAAWLESSGPIEPDPDTVRFALVAARRTPQRAGLRARIAGADAWPRTGTLVYLRHGWLMAALITIAVAMVGGALGAGAILLIRPQPPIVKMPPPAPTPAPSTTPGRGDIGLMPQALVARWFGVARQLPGVESSDDSYLEIEGTLLRMTTRSIDGVMTPHLNATAGAAGADGSVVAIESLIADACPEDIVGTYHWSLSPDGTTLTFEAVEDACAARAAILAGPWTRQACPMQQNWCLGDLDAGRHQSWSFATTTDADGAWRYRLGTLAYEVPSGWANSLDFEASYWLEPTTWYDGYVDARGGVDDGGRTVADGVYVLSRPVASPQDEECTAGMADPSVGESADDLVRFLVNHPALSASTPQPVVIGGLQGSMIDVELKASWTRSCPWTTVPLAQVFTTKGGNVPLAWNPPPRPTTRSDAETRAGAADRYIVLDLGGGRPVLIQISAPTPAELDAMLPDAMAVVESFSFSP